MDTQADGGYPAEIPFEFRGQEFEYFKIWIVNLFLTIITIGIYGPWAKVRNLKYMYNNCYLDGQNFDFDAEPLNILLGRAIALGIFLLLTGVSQVYPVWGGAVFLLVALFCFPWLLVKSLRFRARYSSHRNIRFSFGGTYIQALLVFIVFPLLGMLTLGLLMPYSLYRLRKFRTENSQYGTTSFEFDATGMDYFWTLLKIIGVAILIVIGAGIVSALQPIAGTLVLLLAYPFLYALFEAQVGNLEFNSTLLGLNNFESNLDARELMVIYVVNAIGIVLTLGLFLPAAKVRVARYRASRLQFIAAESLDYFVGKEAEEVSALGEEMGEFMDFDLGI